MTRTGWIVAVFAPAVVVVAASSAVFRPVGGVTGSPTPRPADTHVAATVGRAVGQSGCSSVGCHGGVGGPGVARWVTSAHEWSAADPHRRAFAVLEEPLAVAMMARLYPGEPAKQRASSAARCLACHTNPTLAASTDPHDISLRSEGVSCEACHGSASGWLGPHTGVAGRAAGYEAGRMAKLYDLGERALACAGCHVGAPATDTLPLRDMNHDMIAAGHPRLNFDFATYQFMLPRHWDEKDRAPDFEARAWLVGRIVHAETACLLTADRANRKEAALPEFAEYSCVACHHRIGDPEAKYPASDVKRLGSLPWQPIWPVTTNVPALKDVAAAMRGRRPAPNTPDLATKAAAELARLRTDPLRLPAEHWMKPLPDGVWDRDLTEQVFHAAAALERTRGAQADGAPFATAAAKLRLTRGEIGFHVAPDVAAAVRALVK
ncbi:MAG TPA: multiheme c-type cytochrome [Urbifossiella sp.]|nr:multiheme c-type cytochrome [Urbifossiella sp.]